MLIDMAALIAALAFVVLVGYAVFTLIQVRKTMIELRMVLLNAHSHLPSLLNDLRIMIQKINALTDEARDGIAHGSGFLQAIEAVDRRSNGSMGWSVGKGLCPS